MFWNSRKYYVSYYVIYIKYKNIMYHLKQQINKSIKNKDKENEEITILTFKISKNISLLLLEKLRLTFSQINSQIKVWYTHNIKRI